MAGGAITKTPIRFQTNRDGLVPAPTSAQVSAAHVLQADGTWVAQGGGGSGSDSTARSMATSAGLQASTADSKAVSDSIVVSSNLATTGSQNTSQSTLISTATTNASTADSKAVSVATADSTASSVATSQDTSQSTLISTTASAAAVADSKALSVSVVVSTNLSVTASQNLAQSSLISTNAADAAIADSKAGSVASLDSTSLSTTNSQNTSQSTLISTATTNASAADSKAVSVASNTGTGGTTGSGKTVLDTDPTINGAWQLAEGANIKLDAALSADGTWCGISEAGTAGTALAFGDLVYLAAADSRWELTDADAEATAGPVKLGICVLAAAGDGSATTILLFGKIRADSKFPTLTVSAPAYVGTTAGAIQVAQPSSTDQVIRVVGYGNTADELFFNPSQTYFTHT